MTTYFSIMRVSSLFQWGYIAVDGVTGRQMSCHEALLACAYPENFAFVEYPKSLGRNQTKNGQMAR